MGTGQGGGSGRRVTALELTNMCMDAKEAAVALFGDSYTERVKPWRELLSAVSASAGWHLHETVLGMLSDLDDGGELNSGAAMWLLAAFADEAAQRHVNETDKAGGAA